jgi:hypothetical protein
LILITLDIDWAPDEVIEDTLALFEKYEVKCTLFATHESDVIKNCNRQLFEVGIHPNFNPIINGTSQDSPEKVIDKLLEIYPESKGVRSHSMTQSSPLLDLFKSKGLKYDSNHFLPYSECLEPFLLWNGLFRIPYNWEDDVHFMYKNDFSSFGLDLVENCLNVFDFHPIHVFLNTEAESTYINAKEYYHNPDQLVKFRNTTNTGTRDSLIRLLKKINSDKLSNATLLEFYLNAK